MAQHDSFVFRREFYKTAMNMRDGFPLRKYLMALIRYGLNDEWPPPEDFVINADIDWIRALYEAKGMIDKDREN